MKEKSIRCSCIGGEHYLNFIAFEEDGFIYVDLLAKGNLPFRSKIKEIWKLLTNRTACYDSIILDLDKMIELRNYLEETIIELKNKEL